MINKDKISRVMIYDLSGKMVLVTSSVFFPKDFFKVKGTDFVMLKGSDYPVLPSGTPVDAVFEYATGTRVKYRTSIDLGTEYQMNFRVSEGEVLEERRRSFKIMVDMDGQSPFFIRGEEMFSFANPVEIKIININLGGVLFSSNSDFEPGDQVMLDFMEGEMQLLIEVLRIQREKDGSVLGYGCQFIDITDVQEERLAKFIMDCQVLEREKKMAAESRNNRR